MSTSPKPQSSVVIKKTGTCIEKYLEKLKAKIGPSAADEAREAAAAVVENCVRTYSDIFGAGDVGSNGIAKVTNLFSKGIPNQTTGLLYGKVQSGKTKTAIATIAMAVENGFRCFVFLTSDNTWLGKQTAARIKTGLVGGPVVFHWEEWHSDPDGFAKEKVKPYLGDTGVVLISTKNSSHLKNLKTVLSKSGASGFPAIFIDDEADNASLNTNQAKQAAGTATEPSTIFRLIGEIRALMPNHVYVQVTATPQSLLLQDLNHPCKPVFCNLSMPGGEYMGGEVFFTPGSLHCYEVDSNEILQLKTGKVIPGTTWSIPDGLRKALCCFFVGYAAKVKELGNTEESYSLLAHICHKKISHQNIGSVITSFVIDLDKAIRGKLSTTKAAQAEKWLKEAYEELSKTSSKMPPLDELITDLRDTLRNTIPEIINADNPHKEPQYRPGLNILVGGNRLGRGVTIDGLFITYYGRDAKQKMMDTVHQHARMFGYRKALKDVTRLFIPSQALADFKLIYESDEGMRKAIGDDPTHDIKIKPVWLGPAIKPTRSNVLNLSEIEAFSPGTAIFPPDPMWKKSDIKEQTDTLDKLLASYKGDDTKLHPVDIDSLKQVLNHMPSKHMAGYKWEDKRVIEALSAMKSHDIKNGFLNVRCGKNGQGLDLQRQEAPFKSFADDDWVKAARSSYPNAPVLIIMMEKGLKSLRWDDCRIYIPTLVLPSTGFVFMFNYT